jgi:hypothetical protein
MQISKSMDSQGKVRWGSISLPTYVKQVNNVQNDWKGERLLSLKI